MRVLVVDDNLLSATTVLNQLQRAGHSPVVAAQLPEALFAAQQHLADLILINLAATAFDPPNLIEAIRADPGLRSCRVVGFCGHLEHARRASALEVGCDQVITNAVALRQLAAVLATM